MGDEYDEADSNIVRLRRLLKQAVNPLKIRRINKAIGEIAKLKDAPRINSPKHR
jgi:hypothetical protein